MQDGSSGVGAPPCAFWSALLDADNDAGTGSEMSEGQVGGYYDFYALTGSSGASAQLGVQAPCLPTWPKGTSLAVAQGPVDPVDLFVVHDKGWEGWGG